MNSIIKKIRKEFLKYKIDSYIVSNRFHIRYISNFSGSNGLVLLTGEGNYILTDFRYEEQVKKEVSDFKIVIVNGGLYEEVFQKNLLIKSKVIGFDGERISYDLFQKIKTLYKNKSFKSISGLIEKIASIKEYYEIENLQKASDIAVKTFKKVISEGIKKTNEMILAGRISYQMKLLGAEKDSFDPIVAFKENSSMPHARPSRKVINKSGALTLDFGAIYKGYGSDITRSFYLGKLTHKYTEIYNIVYDAQRYAIEKIRDGIKCKELDSIARNYIDKKGYGKYFGHALGHGLGIIPHSLPIISWKSEDVIKEGMVLTIEPGIYIPDLFGIRIEDDLVVERNGFQNLTEKAEKFLYL